MHVPLFRCQRAWAVTFRQRQPERRGTNDTNPSSPALLETFGIAFDLADVRRLTTLMNNFALVESFSWSKTIGGYFTEPRCICAYQGISNTLSVSVLLQPMHRRKLIAVGGIQLLYSLTTLVSPDCSSQFSFHSFKTISNTTDILS